MVCIAYTRVSTASSSHSIAYSSHSIAYTMERVSVTNIRLSIAYTRISMGYSRHSIVPGFLLLTLVILLLLHGEGVYSLYQAFNC